MREAWVESCCAQAGGILAFEAESIATVRCEPPSSARSVDEREGMKGRGSLRLGLCWLPSSLPALLTPPSLACVSYRVTQVVVATAKTMR